MRVMYVRFQKQFGARQLMESSEGTSAQGTEKPTEQRRSRCENVM
jgi:hypothetical protein